MGEESSKGVEPFGTVSIQFLEGRVVTPGVPVAGPWHASLHRLSLRGHMTGELLDKFLKVHGQSPI
jgi:hypothetical protein